MLLSGHRRTHNTSRRWWECFSWHARHVWVRWGLNLKRSDPTFFPESAWLFIRATWLKSTGRTECLRTSLDGFFSLSNLISLIIKIQGIMTVTMVLKLSLRLGKLVIIPVLNSQRQPKTWLWQTLIHKDLWSCHYIPGVYCAFFTDSLLKVNIEQLYH